MGLTRSNNPEPAIRIGPVPSVQLALMLEYSSQRRPPGRHNDDASLFNNDPSQQQSCCHHTVALPPVTGFPGLEYYGDSATISLSAGVAPALLPGPDDRQQAEPSRFPRSLWMSVTASVPSYIGSVAQTAIMQSRPGPSTPVGSGRRKSRSHRLEPLQHRSAAHPPDSADR